MFKITLFLTNNVSVIITNVHFKSLFGKFSVKLPRG
jgi:hypothetical protein